MTTIKNWGYTSLIFSNDNTEIHKLCINKNGYSSKHYHAYKYNLFFIDDGCLEITIWKNNIEEKFILSNSDTLIIDPNTWHKFYAIENSKVTEIYYTSIDSNDIIRENNN